MKVKTLLLLAVPLLAFGSAAQIFGDRQWQESDVPPPPAFNKDRLIALEMPNYVSLKFGVDPATLAITPDGIVRYVVVASNGNGATNALYEGIRCDTGEVKTYARYAANGQWTNLQDPPWRALNDNQPSRHAMALARQGACRSHSATANSVADIVRALKTRNEELFR